MSSLALLPVDCPPFNHPLKDSLALAAQPSAGAGTDLHRPGEAALANAAVEGRSVDRTGAAEEAAGLSLV
jgi:hypothetical protein